VPANRAQKFIYIDQLILGLCHFLFNRYVLLANPGMSYDCETPTAAPVQVLPDDREGHQWKFPPKFAAVHSLLHDFKRADFLDDPGTFLRCEAVE
jgi:hypothetical protein